MSFEGCPTAWQDKALVFLPPHELLTPYPGFVAVYDGHYLEFDEIHRDTSFFLDSRRPAIPEKHLRRRQWSRLRKRWAARWKLDANRRFYLKFAAKHRIEMPLVAEGHRKLAPCSRA